VSTPTDRRRRVVEVITERTQTIVEALRKLDETTLNAPTDLPEWNRLTIACHLRYGAEALSRMTDGALSGGPVAYYPEGRAAHRPRTLRPDPGETAQAVVAALADRSRRLGETWSSLDEDEWSTDVIEPSDNPDLGAVELSDLALLRLTEVEVHGSDLGLGLGAWSDLFVQAALPMRLDRLNARRPGHRVGGFEGSWLLVATDGPIYRVTVADTSVESCPAEPTSPATAVVEASSRDLLALLLGRSLDRPAIVSGDRAFGLAFSAVFPGP
jgi:maleylpyruvate isomerase